MKSYTIDGNLFFFFGLIIRNVDVPIVYLSCLRKYCYWIISAFLLREWWIILIFQIKVYLETHVPPKEKQQQKYVHAQRGESQERK